MITVVIFWLIGLAVTSFTLISVCICLFFALPTTRRLTREGVLVSPNPLTKRYLTSVFLLSGIFTIISALVYYFGNDHAMKGYIGGAVVSLLFGIWKTGANKTNMGEYLEQNQRYMTHENVNNLKK